jgi:hypothetical protein
MPIAKCAMELAARTNSSKLRTLGSRDGAPIDPHAHSIYKGALGEIESC